MRECCVDDFLLFYFPKGQIHKLRHPIIRRRSSRPNELQGNRPGFYCSLSSGSGLLTQGVPGESGPDSTLDLRKNNNNDDTDWYGIKEPGPGGVAIINILRNRIRERRSLICPFPYPILWTGWRWGLRGNAFHILSQYSLLKMALQHCREQSTRKRAMWSESVSWNSKPFSPSGLQPPKP